MKLKTNQFKKLSKQKKSKSKEWGSNIIRKKIGEWNYKTNYILKSILNKTNSNKRMWTKTNNWKDWRRMTLKNHFNFINYYKLNK